MKTLLAAVAALAALGLSTPSLAASGPVVDSPAGQAEGVSQGDLDVFKGIPYAKAPARWTAPQMLPRWSGVRQSTQYGPGCFEPTRRTPSLYADTTPPPQSEDCLSLNVWVPKGAPKTAKGLPVFFWIYGGALTSRAPGIELYDGSELARQGMVVVTINYRMGVLGYLAHPGLSAESRLGVSGNYGLLDQIAALRWVQKNISAYGGDPSNVTIAGESAGALSVMYLMASPPARGLFAKAIAESAYMVSTPELKRARFGAPSAEAQGEQLAAILHAPNIGALRAMDARTLTDAAPATGYLPWGTIDGKVLPDQLVDVFDKGEQAPVPILTGFNQGEIRSLRVLAPQPPASAADYERAIRERYRDLADAFLKLYPSSDMGESVIETARDALYGWTAERLVRRQTALGQPSYLYLFDHPYPAADDQHLHAFHGSEIPYIFGSQRYAPPLWPKFPDTPAEAAFSHAMTSYWASFAKTGTPAADGEPAWPPYGMDAGFMRFAAVPEPGHHLLPGMYGLDEEVVCRRRASGKQGWNWNVGLWSPPMPDPTPACAQPR